MEKQREMPWQVFRLASSLLPHLDRVFETSTLSPTDLFVLSHIKHFGRDYKKGRKILLKNEMLDLLKRVYGYSPTRATGIVKGLHNEGLLSPEELTEAEKEKYFGERRGYKDALILSDEGVQELDKFNANLNKLFVQLTAGMSPRKFAALSRALTFFSNYAYRKLHDN